MLAPVLASGVIAYLLEAGGLMERRGWPRIVAVWVVFAVFVLFLSLLLFGVMPLVSRQLTDLIQQFPSMVPRGSRCSCSCPSATPSWCVRADPGNLRGGSAGDPGARPARAVVSLASLVGLITVMIYIVLMRCSCFLSEGQGAHRRTGSPSSCRRTGSSPSRCGATSIARSANYVRGKFHRDPHRLGREPGDLHRLRSAVRAPALGAGRTLGHRPVHRSGRRHLPGGVIAWFQWGWSAEFFWLNFAYLVIQALDGNVLVPLLFSRS